MSDDELFVTITAVAFGPLLWTVWLARLSKIGPLRRGRGGVGALAIGLGACALFLFVVLETIASFDVVNAPQYVFMYLVLGLAWLRVSEGFFTFAGLSARDDVVERRNAAAVPAMLGAMAGVTFCYAGGNIGDGPGWWVVVFSAGLATGTLFLAWLVLGHFGNGIDALTIDRDRAAGARLGAFLASCGLVLAALPTWRERLPETRDPRDAPWQRSDAWILKPALGRVGEGIGVRGLIPAKELQNIRRSARWFPGSWVAQRRFDLVPLRIGGRVVFPCLGVYTLDGRVIGAYGRLGSVPLIDARAADAAVLAA